MKPCSGCNIEISGKTNRCHEFCEKCRQKMVEAKIQEVHCYEGSCTEIAKFIKIEQEYGLRFKCSNGHSFVLCRNGFG